MVTPSQIIAPQAVPQPAAGALYTVPSNVTAILKKLTFCNTSGGALTLSVYFGGSASTNAIKVNRVLQASETYECFEAENHILPAGQVIEASASGAGITVVGSALIVS